jgi:nitroreductase
MLDAIKRRRSIRKFKPKEVEKEKLDEILRAAMSSPSAMNRRPWEFIVVKDKEMKNKLSRATPWCSFIKDAPVVLVIAGYGENSFWWIEDCSIATEAIYLEATNQGLGTCFCQVLGAKSKELKDSEEYVREALKTPKNVRILCFLPIGYPDELKEERDEKDFDESKVHYERY